jgi:hypothetical protein
MMMREAGLITGAGSIIPEFFNLGEITITGILAPTGTSLDMCHLLTPENFARLSP